MRPILESLSQVALFFFWIFGLTEVALTFWVSNGAQNHWVITAFEILDLPFLFAALLYGTVRMALRADDITGNPKPALMLCAALSIVVFCGALIVNFYLPDAKFLVTQIGSAN